MSFIFLTMKNEKLFHLEKEKLQNTNPISRVILLSLKILPNCLE